MDSHQNNKNTLTKKELVKIFLKENRGSILSFAFFLWIYIIIVGIEKYPERLITKGWRSINLQYLYDVICKYSSLNWFIVIISIGSAIYLGYRIIQDKDFRLGRILFLVSCGFVLWYPNVFKYPSIIGSFDYRLMWSMLLLGAFICCVPTIIKIIELGRDESKGHGLISNTDELIHDKNTESFSQNVIKRLLDIDLSEEAFAIGITGEWGSGKTTFLNTMKKQLREYYKGEAEIVDFNPWICHSPEQVTNAFFKTLREQLALRHSQLCRPIKDYAKYLDAIKLPSSLSFIDSISAMFIHEDEDTIYKKRDHLSKLFRNMDKPVFVFIDDLDRLDSDEVFEVLRLIRNTADFSNMVYVAVYDKDYIVSILKRMNIRDGSSYLEKIFPLELHLPKASDTLLFEMLLKCMDSMVKDDSLLSTQTGIKSEVMMSFLRRLNEEQRPLLLSVLNSFRRIRNFTHRFLLISYHIQNSSSSKNEIKFRDLLWLELIEMYDKPVYDILYNQPERLLKIHGDKFELLNEDEFKLSSENGNGTEISISSITGKLLEMLYKQNYDISKRSMRYRVNYKNYFYLAVPKEDLSNNEFRNIFNNQNISDDVNKWIRERKDVNSVYYRFHEYRPDGFEQSVAYLKAILEYGVKKEKFSVFAICQLLDSNRYNDLYKAELREEIIKWILEQNNIIYSMSVLKGLYTPISTWYDEYEQREIQECNEKYLINNDDIIDILKSLMRSYLEKQSNLDLMDIFKIRSELWRAFGSCCLRLKVNEMYWESYSKNVAIDIVIDHFSKDPKYQKSEIEEANKKFLLDIENQFRIKNKPISGQDDSYNEYENAIIERVDSEYESYFGTDSRDFNDFLEKCSKKD